MGVGVVTLRTFVEDGRTLVSAARLSRVVKHVGVAAFRALFLDLHLLRPYLPLSVTFRMILVKPFLPFGYEYFRGDRLPAELLEGIATTTPETRDFEGVGL